MQTAHRVHFQNSREMKEVGSASVELVVTSPPYPMIEMWDDGFSARNPSIRRALMRHDGLRAFRLMHTDLDAVWQETHRVLNPGGFHLHLTTRTDKRDRHFRTIPVQKLGCCGIDTQTCKILCVIKPRTRCA